METGTSPLYSVPAGAQALALRRGNREAVRDALLAARERTLALVADYRQALGPEPAIAQHPQRNPPIWEWGHVAWFQEWWIARNAQRLRGAQADPQAPRSASLLPDADALYDSSAVAHASRWSLPLPDAEGTLAYLQRTLEATLELLAQLPDDGDDALYFFRLVALHEAMHAEAACYMAQALDIPVTQPEAILLPAVEPLHLPAQRFRMGAPAQGFAFDNEWQAHEVEIAPVEMDAQAVSWERFLPFVEAGGYEDPSWWSEEGARWLGRQPRRGPAQLRKGSAGWEARRGGRWQALVPGHAAVHLTAHEAEAWCRWSGRQLPSEAQWEAAACTLPGFAWGAVWEWTASSFAPYPGFVAHPYRDYSQPWFGTRRVLRGACAATSPSLAHARYRNFFEPHRNDVFAGFRSCRPG